MTGPRVISESIPSALAGERIDRVVAMIAEVSRSRAVDLITGGQVTVDGHPPEKPSVRVEEDATVSVEVTIEETGLVPDGEVEFDVVYVDDHVVVVDKPAHLVVHPGSGVKDRTLAHGLLAAFAGIADVGQPDRPGIVHRLDKGTSGLLMVARNEHAYESLVQQLATRTVARVYQAVVCGLVESEAGLIDAPLGRSRGDATRRAVVADGRPARTRYEVIERLEPADCTFIECRLETGRTHQIRAHLSAIDHPVLGDERYGGVVVDDLTRPFLHAARLGFEHPVTGQNLTFDSPLPEDLAAALERLRAITPRVDE